MPVIDPSVILKEGSIVKGRVTIGADSSIWYNAVLRAEDDTITIGRGTNIQDCCVIHVDAGAPVVLGDHVTVGHGAILHGCRIGDNTLVGMGSILLNGAVIGKNCLIGAGALVTQHTVIPDNSLVMGFPAKIIRPLTAREIQENQESALEYIRLSRQD